MMINEHYENLLKESDQKMMKKLEEIKKLKTQIEFLTLTCNEAGAKVMQLTTNLDRVKKENNDLYNKIAKLTETDLQKTRESGL